MRTRPLLARRAAAEAQSPAGDDVPRLPPIVPRLRICGDPTVREASASAGSTSRSRPCSISTYVRPEPRRRAPFSRREAAQLVNLVQIQQTVPVARGRSSGRPSRRCRPGSAMRPGALRASAAPRRGCGASGLPRGRRVRFRSEWAHLFHAAWRWPAVTSLQTSSSAAAACSRCSRVSGCRRTSPSSTATSQGSARTTGTR